MKYQPFIIVISCLLSACTVVSPDQGDTQAEKLASIENMQCRDAMRPILLQLNPDRERLPVIQQLCETQAAAGDADAKYHIALLHLGLLDWQPDKAVPLIQSAADQGVAEAQYWLAWQYEEGPLLDNDEQFALQWYVAAGEQEHRLAVSRLLDIYSNGGLGESPDIIKATMYRARLAKCMNTQAAMTGTQ